MSPHAFGAVKQRFPSAGADVDEAPTIEVVVLASFFARLRGLLWRSPPVPGTAVWLVPCRQVHSVGMTYAIDLIYLDRDGRVVRVGGLRPWRFGPLVWRAHSVLELRHGEATRLGLRVGQKPRLIEVGGGATKKAASPRPS